MSGAGGAEQRIIVVGAGIIGICCALALRENGFAVIVLDKDGPGEATSFGAAGNLGGNAHYAIPGLIWKLPRMLLDPHHPHFVPRPAIMGLVATRHAAGWAYRLNLAHSLNVGSENHARRFDLRSDGIALADNRGGGASDSESPALTGGANRRAAGAQSAADIERMGGVALQDIDLVESQRIQHE